MQATVRLAVTTAVLLALQSAAFAQNRIEWAGSWPEAATLAQRGQRLILLHFWNYNCPPCVQLDRRVFNQPEVIRAVHSRYVPLKVNVTDDPKMAEHFKIEKWPTDVIVTTDGREIFRTVTNQDPNRFIATLAQVAAHASVGMPIPEQTANQLPPQQTLGADARAGSSFPTPGQSSAFPLPGSDPSTPQASAAPAAPPTMINNQFSGINNQIAGSLQQNQPPSWAPMAPAYGGQFQPSAAAGAERTMNPPTPVPDGTMPNNRLANEPPPSSTPSPTNPVANGRPVPNAQQPSAQGSVPPTSPQPGAASQHVPGLEGYCPVTLLEQEAWIKGDARWGVLHGGRLFLFTGPEQQQKFLTDFNKYAPALAGYDPVKYVEEGTLVDGKRAHGVYYHDRIVLFADEASLERFWQAPERYASALAAEPQPTETRR